MIAYRNVECVYEKWWGWGGGGGEGGGGGGDGVGNVWGGVGMGERVMVLA